MNEPKKIKLGVDVIDDKPDYSKTAEEDREIMKERLNVEFEE